MGLKRKKTKTQEKQLLTQVCISSETISFPIEMIQEILSRLPVKPLLQFRSVSKQWLSLISNDPSFPKLHFTNSLPSNRISLLITYYDYFTDQQHFLSAAPGDGGGHVTHLMSLPKVGHLQSMAAETQHLNGLILFTTGNGYVLNNSAFVINPSTRHFFKLPPPLPYDVLRVNNHETSQMFNFFGFDELSNEHKVLNIRVLFNKNKSNNIIEFMIFSLCDYSWTKIHVKEEEELPISICGGIERSVCVNSVIHMMLKSQVEILAFDLRTYTFEIIKIPNDAIPLELPTSYHAKGFVRQQHSHPLLMKTNGLLALFCHHHVLERNEMDVWILQDYQNRVWIKETLAFSKSWINLDSPYPLDFLSKGEIVFSLKMLPKNRISVPVYDMKTGKFKSVKFTLRPELLHSAYLMFYQVRIYFESILPLRRIETVTL